MAEYIIQGSTLDAIADAINAKTGGSSSMTPAEMVTEIGSIETGGATNYTGYVELSNVDTNYLVIPVDVSAATKYEIYAYVVETGIVSGGVITKDSEPMVHTENGNLIWYFTATERHDEKHIKRDENNYSAQTRPYNNCYCWCSYGNNGNQMGLDIENKSGTQIKLPAGNATRFFCKTGCYVKFQYLVAVEA